MYTCMYIYTICAAVFTYPVQSVRVLTKGSRLKYVLISKQIALENLQIHQKTD